MEGGPLHPADDPGRRAGLTSWAPRPRRQHHLDAGPLLKGRRTPSYLRGAADPSSNRGGPHAGATEAQLGDTGIVMLSCDPICMVAPLSSWAKYRRGADRAGALSSIWSEPSSSSLVEATSAALPGRLWRVVGPSTRPRPSCRRSSGSMWCGTALPSCKRSSDMAGTRACTVMGGSGRAGRHRGDGDDGTGPVGQPPPAMWRGPTCASVRQADGALWQHRGQRHREPAPPQFAKVERALRRDAGEGGALSCCPPLAPTGAS